MDDAKRRYTDDVPDDVEVRLREVCLALPDAYEERAWKGTRWMVRKKTFAHVLGVEMDTGHVVVTESFCVLAPQKLIALVDRPDHH